jgi:hypothetical protein
VVSTPHLFKWINSEWTDGKACKLRNQRKARSEDFVLICATTVGFMEFLEISEILESVTYAFSMCPIVGAPHLASEMWELQPRSLLFRTLPQKYFQNSDQNFAD